MGIARKFFQNRSEEKKEGAGSSHQDYYHCHGIRGNIIIFGGDKTATATSFNNHSPTTICYPTTLVTSIASSIHHILASQHHLSQQKISAWHIPGYVFISEQVSSQVASSASLASLAKVPGTSHFHANRKHRNAFESMAGNVGFVKLHSPDLCNSFGVFAGNQLDSLRLKYSGTLMCARTDIRVASCLQVFKRTSRSSASSNSSSSSYPFYPLSSHHLNSLAFCRSPTAFNGFTGPQRHSSSPFSACAGVQRHSSSSSRHFTGTQGHHFAYICRSPPAFKIIPRTRSSRHHQTLDNQKTIQE